MSSFFMSMYCLCGCPDYCLCSHEALFTQKSLSNQAVFSVQQIHPRFTVDTVIELIYSKNVFFLYQKKYVSE